MFFFFSPLPIFSLLYFRHLIKVNFNTITFKAQVCICEHAFMHVFSLMFCLSDNFKDEIDKLFFRFKFRFNDFVVILVLRRVLWWWWWLSDDDNWQWWYSCQNLLSCSINILCMNKITPHYFIMYVCSSVI